MQPHEERVVAEKKELDEKLRQMKAALWIIAAWLGAITTLLLRISNLLELALRNEGAIR
jgi:hypothetical protein